MSTVSNSDIKVKCNKDVVRFNESSTFPIERELAALITQHRITPEMREYYQAAHDAWNGELRRFKNSYTRVIRSNLRNLPVTVRGSTNMLGLEDYQKFFVLFAEATTGINSGNVIDSEKAAAWNERANPSKMLNNRFQIIQESDCTALSDAEIRALIAPKMLPDKIEECVR